MSLMLGRIQRFCLHDGPGIRTTIFIKGCSIHCPWCANPELISFDKDYFCDRSKIDFNLDNNIQKYIDKNLVDEIGEELNIDDIYNIVMKDKNYYGLNGGVTFSGGEPLANIFIYENLLKKLKSENINVVFETSLFVSLESLKLAINYSEDFYIDIKILDKEKCLNILGGNIDLFLSNFEYLISSNKNMFVRFPIIKDYTDDDENIDSIIKILKKNNVKEIEIFSGHMLAEKKYQMLGKEILRHCAVSDDKLQSIKNKFANEKILAKIIKI